MSGTAVFILVSGCLSSLALAQPVEVYNFKDDCAKRFGTSSYISTCNYTSTYDHYVDQQGKLTDHGTRYINGIRAGLKNEDSKANLTFAFRYGEVRWRATMLPVNCSPSTNSASSLMIRPWSNRWHLNTDVMTLLVCQFDERFTLVTVLDLRSDTGVWHCPFSSNSKPRLCGPGVLPGMLHGLHNYTLRWTADELTWLIDNVKVAYLRDKKDIPHHMMVLTVYDIDMVTHERYLNMIVESVSVWQDPVDAKSVLSGEHSPGQQQNRQNGQENQTDLVKVFSLLDKCRDAGDNLVDVYVPICSIRDRMDYYLQLNGSFRLNGAIYTTNAEIMSEAIKSTSANPFSFLFRFGEVRWRALALPTTHNYSLLGINGPDKQPDTDIHNSVFRLIEIVVLFRRLESALIYSSFTYALIGEYNQGDSSNLRSTNLPWMCLVPDCDRYALKWNEVHTYTLRWTSDEILWLIDDIPIHRLTDQKKIPRHPMKLQIYDPNTPNILASGEFQNMMVESVSVWQNWTSLVRPDLTLHFQDNFTDSHLDGQNWRAIHNAISRPLLFPSEYDSKLVSVENGTLRLQVSHINDRFSFGRVDGAVENDLLYPGEVVWRMRFQYNPEFLSILRVQKNECKHAGNLECFSSSIPAVGFACDEWGKVRTTLDLGILHYIPDESGIKIPVDLQRKRYDQLLTEGTLDDFHIYRIVWTGEYIAWYIDDHEIDREDLTAQYRLLEEPLSVSMGPLLSEEASRLSIRQGPHRAFLLMEIKHVALRSSSKIGAGHVAGTQNDTANDLGKIYEQGTQWKASYTISTITFLAVCGTVITTVYLKRRRRRRNNIYSLLNASDHPSGTSLFHLNSPTPGLAYLVTRYTELLEVPENCIDIQGLSSPITILGKGNYGVVLRVVARHLPTIQRGPTVVAIKILSENTSVEAQTAFSNEVKMLVKAGGHVNVVNILGVVKQGQPSIILEYCKFGSLGSYLRSHPPNAFYVHVDIAGTLLPFDESTMKNQWLLVDNNNGNRNADLLTISSEMLCTGDLVQFSSQISRGMEYLGTRCIIHRDLAARNVLVSERRILKISDFGLARYAEQTYVTEHPNVRLPYLWLPPDAITTKTFSSKSDVWSFGVLLYEIFTLGDEPFNGPNVTRLPVSAFVNWLMLGNQMARPPGSPSAIYEVMQQCWKLNYADRPTFSELRKKLDAMALVAVKSDHYVSLAQDEQTADIDQSPDSEISTYSELVNLQRMIAECCAEPVDLAASQPSTIPDSTASCGDFSYSRL